VLLSGAGGDDILTGYRRHYALMQEKYWKWLPQGARSAIATAAKQIPVGGPVGRRLNKAFRMAHWPEDKRIAGYFYWAQPTDLENLYSEAMKQRLAERGAEEPLLASLRKLPDHVPPLNRMLYLEGKHFLADHNLNYTDRMGMATGVEVRVPLLDIDLIEFCAQLPLSLKQRGKTGKYLLKRAMEPFLPHDVIWRKKAGFGAPVRTWIKSDLNERIEELLSTKSLKSRGLFQPTAVRKLLIDNRRGKIDGAYLIFALMCIELWCRLFVDQVPLRKNGE
jgi:asparagine synthase (glutamine-hydrolysing)